MIKLGLTGSIGSGKSSISMLAASKLGIPVFDADKTVHDLYATDQHLQEFLMKQCGADIVKDGRVDRTKLGAFKNQPNNEKAWHDIEQAVHGRLWDRFDAFSKTQEEAGAELIIADVPLLFEAGSEKRFDYTVNVSVPYAVQKQRALDRATPKLTEEEFERRLIAFMPDDERNAKADFVIDNSGGIDASLLKLRAYMKQMENKKAKFKQNKIDIDQAVVYVGSFDPITLGHLDIIKAAARMPYPTFYIGVGINPEKNPMFSVEERIAMIEHEMDRDVRPFLPEGREIVVTSYEGLTIDFMKKVGASLCIRGLRGIKDLEEENALAAVNTGLFADSQDNPGSNPFAQAYFVTTDPELRHVSSSYARGICTMGVNHDLSLLRYVSADVAAEMIKKRTSKAGGPV